MRSLVFGSALILGLSASVSVLSAGCGGDDDGVADGGRLDGGRADGGDHDAGTSDGGGLDARVDGGTETDGGTDTDGGGADAGDADAGSADGGRPDGGGACTSDADCAFGSEWCEAGACVACDNSGALCDLACTLGWDFPTRHGCTPCRCAPSNACVTDGDCGAGLVCLAGAWCFPDCLPAGDPTCCQGNVCAGPTCSTPPPVGCRTRGCPWGDECRTDMGCAPSACGCGAGDPAWICTADCSGGVCATP